MGNLGDETAAKLAGRKQDPGETIEGVEKQAKDMSAVQGAMSTARQLAGTDALQGQIEEANKRAEKATEAARKAEEDKHRAEIDKVEATLGAKIDNLGKAYVGGASKESIADQIAEIKKAATELNMGGSKISEIREMMNLITSLNPQKSLVEQITNAKELINVISPPPEKKSEFAIEGMPASIALQLKKMDHDLQITLETMKDERQRRQEEFQLTIKQWDIDRQDRINEAQGRIQVEQERNKMIAGSLETVGRAIGKGIAEAGAPGSQRAGPIAGSASQTAKSYTVDLGPDDTNKPISFDCPTCQTKVAAGPDATEATCINCQSQFTFSRKPATQMPVAQSEEE
jgi:hypothetical protein